LPGLEDGHLAQIHSGAVWRQGREDSGLLAPSRYPDEPGGIEIWEEGFGFQAPEIRKRGKGEPLGIRPSGFELGTEWVDSNFSNST
jgi:hypothetical protein